MLVTVRFVLSSKARPATNKCSILARLDNVLAGQSVASAGLPVEPSTAIVVPAPLVNSQPTTAKALVGREEKSNVNVPFVGKLDVATV